MKITLYILVAFFSLVLARLNSDAGSKAQIKLKKQEGVESLTKDSSSLFMRPPRNCMAKTASTNSIEVVFMPSVVSGEYKFKQRQLNRNAPKDTSIYKFEWSTDPFTSNVDNSVVSTAFLNTKTHVRNQNHTISCNKFHCRAELTNLKPDQKYFIRVAACGDDLTVHSVYSQTVEAVTSANKKEKIHNVVAQPKYDQLVSDPYYSGKPLDHPSTSTASDPAELNTHSSINRKQEYRVPAQVSALATDPLSIDLITASTGLQIAGSSKGCVNGNSGASLKNLGDVDDDGYDDFIVGAPSCSGDTGAAYIVFGNNAMYNMDLGNLGDSGITISGPNQNANLGSSVAGAGDFNGDGFDDILVSVTNYVEVSSVSANEATRRQSGESVLAYHKRMQQLEQETNSQKSQFSQKTIEEKVNFAHKQDKVAFTKAQNKRNKRFMSYENYNSIHALANNSTTDDPTTDDPATDDPTSPQTCPPYSVSNTNSATTNYASCPLLVCPQNYGGSVQVTVGSCSNTYTTNAMGNGVNVQFTAVNPTGTEKAAKEVAKSATTTTNSATSKRNATQKEVYAVSEAPSEAPSTEPSQEPSTEPTEEPTETPTSSTTRPSETPSASPSAQPTEISAVPSTVPTITPSSDTSATPSTAPSQFPSQIPSASPTTIPTHTRVPTTSVPSHRPSVVPTQGEGDDFVGADDGDDTNSLTDDTNVGLCTGDQYLSVYQGSIVAGSNDDYCGLCSQVTFVVSGDACTMYSIHEGCYGAGACSATVEQSFEAISGLYSEVYVIFGGPNKMNGLSSINLAKPLNSVMGFGMQWVSLDPVQVSAAGDVNQDGYGDILIGYPTVNGGSGYVFLVFGTPSPFVAGNISIADIVTGNSTDGVALQGAPGSGLGYSVSTAGDFNGDGFPDIIVGAPNADGTRGLTYLIFGTESGFENLDLGSSLSTSIGVTFTGDAIGDYSGITVANAGDVNGDGYDDVLIGATGATSSAGMVYVLYGSASPKNVNLGNIGKTQGVTILGANTFDELGSAISTAGDVNGDGYADILLGVSNIAKQAGQTYVIYGSATLTNVHLATLSSTQGLILLDTANPYFQSGYAVSYAGDVNRDMYADFLIGAPQFTLISNTAPSLVPTTHPNGISFLIFGRSDIASTATVTLSALTNIFTVTGSEKSLSYYTGYCVAVLGDVNGDGYSDIAVSAPYAGPNYNGITYIIYGAESGFNGVNLNAFTGAGQGVNITGVTTDRDYYSYYSSGEEHEVCESVLGYAVIGAGDFNNDNNQDILVSAPYACVGDIVSGIVYVIFGGPGLQNLNVGELTQETGVSIYLGQTDAETWIDYTLGYAISNAGDVNGDGIDDVILGTLLCDSYPFDAYCYTYGLAYVVFGAEGTDAPSTIELPVGSSTVMPKTQGAQFVSPVASTSFGSAVGGGADLNNDGYADLLIGDAMYNNGAGIVYVIYGQPSLAGLDLTTLAAKGNGFTITGNQATSIFGYVVSFCGDFNGDGFPDFVIGAPTTATSTTLQAASYIIYGGKNIQNINIASFTAANGVKITSGSVGDLCGYTVSGAGDINYDGFPDVIIGCPYANDYAGATYVIFGGKSVSNVVLSSITNDQGFEIAGAYNYDNSGYSVSGASDTAGHSMVLIGAPASHSLLGSAYVVLESSSFSTNQTFGPTERPTSMPSAGPTSNPSTIPTCRPNPSPTPLPTNSPTPPPFFVTNGPLIAGVLIPTVLGFIPIFFSKQICFKVLDAWGSQTDAEAVINQNRSKFKQFIYTTCKRSYLEAYTAMKAAKEEKKKIDEKVASDIEMMNTLVSPPSVEPKSKTTFPAVFGRGTESASGTGSGSNANANNAVLSTANPMRHSLSDVYDSDDEDDYESANAAVAGSGSNKGVSSSISSGSGRNDRTVMAVYSVTYDNEVINRAYHGNRLGDVKTVAADNKHVAYYSPPNTKFNHPKQNANQQLPVQFTNTIDALLFGRMLIEYLPVAVYWTNTVTEVINTHYTSSRLITSGNTDTNNTANTNTDTNTNSNTRDSDSIITTATNKLTHMPRISQNTLTTLHFLSGHIAVLLMPVQARVVGLILSTASSSVYALRVLGGEWLTNYRQTVVEAAVVPTSNKADHKLNTLAQQCTYTVLFHITPTVIYNTVRVFVVPTDTSELFALLSNNLGFSAALGGAECFQLYTTIYPAVGSENKKQLLSDTQLSLLASLPLTIDIISLAYFASSLDLSFAHPARRRHSFMQLLSLSNKLMTVDYLSRVAVDIVQHNIVSLYDIAAHAQSSMVVAAGVVNQNAALTSVGGIIASASNSVSAAVHAVVSKVTNCVVEAVVTLCDVVLDALWSELTPEPSNSTGNPQLPLF